MAALAEKLPNLDFVMSMGLPNDVAAEVGDLAQFAAMLAGTRKPLLTTAHDAVSLRRMKDMAAMCGEAAQLRLLRDAQPAAHPQRARRWTRSAPAPSSTSRSSTRRRRPQAPRRRPP